jgi:hypothetical protein
METTMIDTKFLMVFARVAPNHISRDNEANDIQNVKNAIDVVMILNKDADVVELASLADKELKEWDEPDMTTGFNDEHRTVAL